MKLNTLVFIAAVAVGLTGCHTDSPTTEQASIEKEYTNAQRVHHEALEARLGPNGEIDLQLALDLFASVYGVDMQTPTTILPGVAHGHMAVGAVLGHWDELTAAQRQIVNQAIARARSLRVGTRLLAPSPTRLALRRYTPRSTRVPENA